MVADKPGWGPVLGSQIHNGMKVFARSSLEPLVHSEHQESGICSAVKRSELAFVRSGLVGAYCTQAVAIVDAYAGSGIDDFEDLSCRYCRQSEEQQQYCALVDTLTYVGKHCPAPVISIQHCSGLHAHLKHCICWHLHLFGHNY